MMLGSSRLRNTLLAHSHFDASHEQKQELKCGRFNTKNSTAADEAFPKEAMTSLTVRVLAGMLRQRISFSKDKACCHSPHGISIHKISQVPIATLFCHVPSVHFLNTTQIYTTQISKVHSAFFARGDSCAEGHHICPQQNKRDDCRTLLRLYFVFYSLLLKNYMLFFVLKFYSVYFTLL